MGTPGIDSLYNRGALTGGDASKGYNSMSTNSDSGEIGYSKPGRYQILYHMSRTRGLEQL